MNIQNKKKSIKILDTKSKEGKKKINPASGNITNSGDQNGYMSILSHEIRTPLATICSSADLIQRINKKEVSKNETGSDPRIKEHAVKIRESAYRVIELLDTIIALNNLETGNYSCSSDNIEIIPLFNNLIEKVEMDYAQIPEIKTEFKLEESCCLADKKLLDLIFSNLISNAIKFSRNNDIVNINVKLIDSVIKFEIIDRGIGIPKSDKSKLFDPFFRGSNAGETSGNGLGMFIIKKTVKLLKGKISFRSKIMVGSKFRVEIPVKLK